MMSTQLNNQLATITTSNWQNEQHIPLVQIIFGVVKPDSDLQSIAVTNKTKYVIHHLIQRKQTDELNSSATAIA